MMKNEIVLLALKRIYNLLSNIAHVDSSEQFGEYRAQYQGLEFTIEKEVARLEVEIAALQKELDELKEKYRWHKIADDGLPELDQDVEIINMRTMEMQAGHFFDYNEGEPEPDIMFDDHNDTTFALSELPKKYQWRYLNAPKEGE